MGFINNEKNFGYLRAKRPEMAVACLKISNDNKKNLKKYDCVVISTDHSSYNYNFIAQHSRLIVDTRNAMKGVPGFAEGKIIKA